MENVDEETEAKLAQVGNIAKNGRICLFLLEGRIQHWKKDENVCYC